MKTNIGIIGLGRLGAALARGLDRSGYPGRLYGFNRTLATAEAVAARVPSLRLLASEAEVLCASDLVFLWTKPPDARQVLETHRELIRQRRPLLVTCVIGIPLAEVTERWAECLPNINLAVRQGVTALHVPADLGASDRRLVREALAAVGSVHELPPDEIPFYSALCSCGPALYATVLEQFADALAARRGYDRALCRQLVHETARGTLDLLAADGADAAEIVRRVAHPGGPSEAGVAFLRAELPPMYEGMLKQMHKW